MINTRPTAKTETLCHPIIISEASKKWKYLPPLIGPRALVLTTTSRSQHSSLPPLILVLKQSGVMSQKVLYGHTCCVCLHIRNQSVSSKYIQVISLCQLAMSAELNVSFTFVIVITSTLKGEGGLRGSCTGGGGVGSQQ